MNDSYNDKERPVTLKLKDPSDPQLFHDTYTLAMLAVTLADCILLSGTDFTTEDAWILTKHLKMLETTPFLRMKDNHTGRSSI